MKLNSRDIFFSVALMVCSLSFAGPLPAPTIPNPANTTGALCAKTDQDYTEDRYQEKIPYCTRNVSSKLKKRVYAVYGVPEECQSQYTIDHFYPLSLGGNNTALNLWPEHKAVKRVRQNLEMDLYLKISNGDIKQDLALRTIEEAKLHPDLSLIPSGSYCDLNPKKTD